MISLLQYAYWLLVFVISGYLFSDGEIRRKISRLFAIAFLFLLVYAGMKPFFKERWVPGQEQIL